MKKKIQRPDHLTLRRLLWMNHGCKPDDLYKNGGLLSDEMYCKKCLIDFKRDSPKQINERLGFLNLKKIDSGKTVVLEKN